MNNTPFFDTHCHLDMCKTGIDRLVYRARQNGVSRFVVPGVCGLPNCCHELAKYREIGLGYGFHPIYSKDALEHLKEIKNLPPVCAIGECGLDKRINTAFEVQERAFKLQLELAAKNKLPAIIHLVGRFQRAYEIIEAMPQRPVCVFHSYSGSAEMALRFAKLGAYISLSASAAKNPKKLRALFNSGLQSRLLLETDSPSQKPYFCSEEENSPALLPRLAREIAQILETDIEKFSEIIYNNSIKVFGQSKLIKL